MVGGGSCTTTRPDDSRVTRAIVARAPTRLDLGGGWTDVPPYPEREGGAVCSVAISRYATATAALDERMAHVAGTFTRSDDPLTAAALRRAKLAGSVASVVSDYPAGAGLGGSSACGVALAGALAMLRGEALSQGEIAAHSRETEVEELRIPGGYQDHYAAAYGGGLLLRFTDCVGVERLVLPASTAERFVRRGILLYTGESRLSGETVAAVRDAYVAGDSRTTAALARMKALAIDMAEALRGGELDALGRLLREHWEHQRMLHPRITTPKIETIVDTALHSGALGVKALGASGGGCVFAIAAEGREDELAKALSPLGELLRYDIDRDGFQIVAVLDESHTESRDEDGSDA
jgi:D-glycero-alpha-D-manno-heptose-7-phosphate kinase